MTAEEIQKLSGVLTREQIPAGYAPQEISPGKFQFTPAELTALAGTGTPANKTYTGIDGKTYNTITANALAPTPALPFVTPGETSAVPVVVPEKPVVLGQEQVRESDINKRIRELNETIAGRPTFETEQRKVLGVEAKTATQTSLYNQLLGLKAQTENIPAVLQAESEGRGRTAAGIAPIEAGRLRNAGIQATILNSQYAAATNDLASAERLVAQAVNDKFAPYEAQRDALLKNLQLIKDSPEYSAEQKQRADAQTVKIKADADKKEIAKTVVSEILKLANSVASSEIQDGGNALAVQQIASLVDTDNKALGVTQEDRVRALVIAQKYLAKPDQLPSSAQEYNFARLQGYKGSYSQYQDEDANRKIQLAKASVGQRGTGGLVDAVLSNPELFSQLSPTQKAALAPELSNLGFSAFGKPLSDTAIKEINQTDYAISALRDLRAKIESNIDKIGPITGLMALNPYSSARRIQADIDRVKQTVGKALEGGVLRKEDEEKYKKILATITDTPETALYKVDALLNDLQRNIANYSALQSASGRQVPSLTTDTESLRTKYQY